MNALAPLEEAVSVLKDLRRLDGIGRDEDPAEALAECVKVNRLADEALTLACEVRAGALAGLQETLRAHRAAEGATA